MAVAVSMMLAGAVKEAPVDGVTMLTLGPTLGGGLTIMVIGLEVVTAPELSVALAVRLKIPVERRPRSWCKGWWRQCRAGCSPKKSTFIIAPSVSKAAALMAMLAGLVKVALLAGLVRPTVGGTLGGGLTVTMAPVEVVVAPECPSLWR